MITGIQDTLPKEITNKKGSIIYSGGDSPPITDQERIWKMTDSEIIEDLSALCADERYERAVEREALRRTLFYLSSQFGKP